MATKLPLRRRVATAARWPVGVCLTSWRYMWRTTPLRRTEAPGNDTEDCPPSLPPDFDRSELQDADDGVGPLYHRRYEARITGASLTPEELMTRLRQDLDAFAPSEFASFQKLTGEEGEMRPGDEYVVRMPGPWDGPVRVVAVEPDRFRLATLAGHLEAGQIEFSAASGRPMRFTIESWARSADRLSDLLYTHARMAKEVQLHMWTSVLERAIEHSGGRREGRLVIETRAVDREGLAGRATPTPRRRRALTRLAHAGFNFDRSRLGQPSDEWTFDDRRQPLPPEPPGPPVAGGSFEIARRLLRDYDVADPSIVRALYDPATPLEGRNMLLELRFLVFRFLTGTRVTRVYEDTRMLDGEEVFASGWSYATLEGHLEQGEMSWEVVKRLDSGEVEFRVHAFSQHAPIRNPLTRLGFRLFARREQRRFLRHAGERILRLVEREQRERPSGHPHGTKEIEPAAA